MLDICIVDDDHQDAQAVKRMVEAYMDKRNIEVHRLDVYHETSRLLQDHKSYDLLFLDIEVGSENGIDCAKQMRLYAPDMIIIVITSYLKYSMEGYKIQAARYLLKPVPSNLLYSELDEVLALYHQDAYLLCEDETGIQRIQQHQVSYIESDGRKSVIHLEQKSIPSKESISYWRTQLSCSFVECYKGILVHVKWIERIEKESLYLENGICLPLARRRFEEVYQAWWQYQEKRI